MPKNYTNEYADNGVVSAATEVIDGITYQVFYLTGDDKNNRSIIDANSKNTNGNYRYVMTADWDLTGTLGNSYILGNAVIFDLNGHVVTAEAVKQLAFYATTSELTDSSAAGTGRIDNNNGCTAGVMYSCSTFIISGGKCSTTSFHVYSDAQIVVRGGNYTSNDTVAVFRQNAELECPITYAPYLIVEDNGGFHPYDAYAVSTTPYASGLYNYAYGYRWEITVAELNNLAIPTDKTYYLWVRNKGDAWYHYLNLRYIDGAWQAA